MPGSTTVYGMTDVVTVEWPHDGVAVITMTNPALSNFGSWIAIEQLARALETARENGARAVVIASGVPGHWLQHAWLRDLGNTMGGLPTTGDGASWFRAMDELSRTSVVSIAAISGDTSGGGCELGWACDLRIAEEQVLFSQPEVGIGVGTGLGGTSRLRQLIGRTATAEVVLLGRQVSAERMYELGGLNRVVPTGTARAVAVEWAASIAGSSVSAVAGMKRMLTEGDDLLRIAEAVMNDQIVFQSFSGQPEALERMAAIQARFDAGESTRDVYGGDRADVRTGIEERHG